MSVYAHLHFHALFLKKKIKLSSSSYSSGTQTLTWRPEASSRSFDCVDRLCSEGSLRYEQFLYVCIVGTVACFVRKRSTCVTEHTLRCRLNCRRRLILDCVLYVLLRPLALQQTHKYKHQALTKLQTPSSHQAFKLNLCEWRADVDVETRS